MYNCSASSRLTQIFGSRTRVISDLRLPNDRRRAAGPHCCRAKGYGQSEATTDGFLCPPVTLARAFSHRAAPSAAPDKCFAVLQIEQLRVLMYFWQPRDTKPLRIHCVSSLIIYLFI